MNTPRPLDDIDHMLLEVLQEHGRKKHNELAEMTGLSLPSISDRLKVTGPCWIRASWAGTLRRSSASRSIRPRTTSCF